ncbi:hypothetical protein [Mesorhizobium shangrilense]|uniref:Uncharacterized protein n=1 Tax=Mesorhizobium shangrilense TaxID=460060 RepID=A0ABV2DJ53_9HYPH
MQQDCPEARKISRGPPSATKEGKQEKRFKRSDGDNREEKPKALSYDAGVSSQDNEQPVGIPGPRGGLEEVVDEAIARKIPRHSRQAVEADQARISGDFGSEGLSPLSDRGGRACSGGNRAGGCSANTLESVGFRQFQGGIGINDTAGDAALHHKITISGQTLRHRPLPKC